MRNSLVVLLLFSAVSVHARHKNKPDQPAMGSVIERLDALEEQNRQLLEELRALRQQISNPATAAAAPPTAVLAPPTDSADSVLEERVDVNAQRISEQAQTKVEASQKFPLRLNGMLLFNAFLNSGQGATVSGASELLAGPDRSGATVRQTLVGLQFDGPHLPGNGRVNGDVLMDFWAGPSRPGDSWLRLRQATVSLDWTSRNFSVGQNKPLISPYQPESLAEVGIPPLAGAGNLWLWLPQARYQERIRLGSDSGIDIAASILQTDETYAQTPTPYAGKLDAARPAVETRAAFWHRWDDARRFEVGSGFHESTSHLAGQSVASRAYTADWSFSATGRLRLTGMFYRGQDLAGLGALNNGFYFDEDSYLRPVQSTGGWSQLSWLATSHLTWNVFAGTEQDRNLAATAGAYARRFIYASNLLYHLGPNVVVGLEASQSRSKTALEQSQLQNHYDLAIGYLF